MEVAQSFKIRGHSDKPNLWYINWYAFFIAFPCLDLIGFSITFYFFILLLYHKGAVIAEGLQRPFPMRLLIFAFLVGAFISTFLGPPLSRPPPITEDAVFFIQHVYWIVIAGFFISFGKSLNLLEISKYLFWGVVCAFIFFYFLPEIKIKNALFGLSTKPNRNGVIYTCLAVIPFCFYYIHTRWGKSASIYLLILFNLAIIFTEGRSGTLVFLLETALIVQVLFPFARNGFKVLMLFILMLYFASSMPNFQPILNGFANLIEGANPRAAKLIREGQGDLTEDRSWLVRLLMVEKALEIHDKYPIFGIGINHFKAMDGSLRMHYIEWRLQKYTKHGLNQTSAHNSYFQLLAENGIWGITCVLIIVLLCNVTLIVKLALNLSVGYSDLILVGLFGISIHWYTIASFMGGVTWLMIALAVFARKNNF